MKTTDLHLLRSYILDKMKHLKKNYKLTDDQCIMIINLVKKKLVEDLIQRKLVEDL